MPAIRPSRSTAAIVGGALLVGGGAAIAQARADASAAEEAERRAAHQKLDRELHELRTELAGPAHAAERASNDLLHAVVESVTGSDRDAAAVRATLDELVADLRAAADELDAASGTIPVRPPALAVETADPMLSQASSVDAGARQAAAALRETADRAEAFADAAHELTVAASTYAASTGDLPDSDDPDALATAWRAERERLDAYADAVEVAAGVEGLEELAASHGAFVDTMRELADDAVARLEAGDVDGYNARLAEARDDESASDLGADLVEATRTALGAATVDELQRTRERVLQLLLDLEDLRRVSGPAAVS